MRRRKDGRWGGKGGHSSLQDRMIIGARDQSINFINNNIYMLFEY